MNPKRGIISAWLLADGNKQQAYASIAHLCSFSPSVSHGNLGQNFSMCRSRSKEKLGLRPSANSVEDRQDLLPDKFCLRSS